MRNDLTDNFFVTSKDTGYEVIEWAEKIDSLGSALISALENDGSIINVTIACVMTDYARAIASVLKALGSDFNKFVSERGKNPIDILVRSREQLEEVEE